MPFIPPLVTQQAGQPDLVRLSNVMPMLKFQYIVCELKGSRKKTVSARKNVRQWWGGREKQGKSKL